MSNRALNYVWQHSKQSGSALLVLIAIADAANDDGECYPGVSRLADKCRMKDRNLQRIIRQLEADKEIEVDYFQGADTMRGWTNRYRVVMEGVQDVAPVGVQGSTPVKTQGVQDVAPVGVQDVAPKPLVEPKEKEKEIVAAVAVTSSAAKPASVKASKPQKPKATEPPGAAEPPKPRRENPNQGIHDALIVAFGLELDVMTKSGDSAYWKAAAELKPVGITPDDVPRLYAFVADKARREEWHSFTVNAVAKYAQDYLADKRRSSKPRAPTPRTEPVVSTSRVPLTPEQIAERKRIRQEVGV